MIHYRRFLVLRTHLLTRKERSIRQDGPGGTAVTLGAVNGLKRQSSFFTHGTCPLGVHGAVLCQGLWQRDKRHAGKMLNVKAEPLQGKAQKVRMVAVYTGKKTDSGFAKTEAQRDHSLVQEQPIAQPEPEPTPSLSRLSQNSNTSLHSPQLSPSIQVGT